MSKSQSPLNSIDEHQQDGALPQRSSIKWRSRGQDESSSAMTSSLPTRTPGDLLSPKDTNTSKPAVTNGNLSGEQSATSDWSSTKSPRNSISPQNAMTST